METKIIQIEQCIQDRKFYPRVDVDWVTSYKYQKAMESGAIFPNIIVAKWNGKYIVLDGFHRLLAYKNLKQTHVKCDIVEVANEKELFLLAVKYNISHGRQFSSQERVQIILKLEDWNMSQQMISEIVRIPIDDLKQFVAKRIVRISETDQPGALKGLIRNIAGTEQSASQMEDQKIFGGRTQLQIIDTLIHMIQNDWIDLKSETIVEHLTKLQTLLNEKIIKN